MILVLLTWLIAGFCFFMIGFFTIKLISRFTGVTRNIPVESPDEVFFAGFISLSVLTGILSVWLPVGNGILLISSIVSVLVLILNFREFKMLFSEFRMKISAFTKREKLFFLLVIFFILSAVVHRITLGDTESYHAQSIQWVRKYSVVPGLGNIHGRLAFNSMFFVVSGIFTIQFKDILVYPLKGICYLVLAIKLVSLSISEFRKGILWKALFYILVMLISVLILLPDLNSPAPDVICSILIMYLLALVLEHSTGGKNLNPVQVVLFVFTVFVCISFKLSSIFLAFILIFVLNKNILKRSVIAVSIGIIALSSFFIRNYYLSGYLVYPYPKADFFNVDWKIPVNRVHEMKLEIESWAKVGSVPSTEVDSTKVNQWLPVWFKALNFNNKVLVIINMFSLFLVPVSLGRKDYMVSLIQLIIFLNLLFWFKMAPDPRFAYGFLFSGFALTIAYITKLLGNSSGNIMRKVIKTGLICFILIISGRRIMSPVETLMNPSHWVFPEPFGSVSTNEYDAGFKYRVPAEDRGCCNSELPCVPYVLTDVVLRGNDLHDGFKVIINK